MVTFFITIRDVIFFIIFYQKLILYIVLMFLYIQIHRFSCTGKEKEDIIYKYSLNVEKIK